MSCQCLYRDSQGLGKGFTVEDKGLNQTGLCGCSIRYGCRETTRGYCYSRGWLGASQRFLIGVAEFRESRCKIRRVFG